jgi:hypothetical protein
MADASQISKLCIRNRFPTILLLFSNRLLQKKRTYDVVFKFSADQGTFENTLQVTTGYGMAAE